MTLLADKDEPRFFKANTVPFALRAKVDESLDELLKQDIIEPVRNSKYACPLVVVNKPDGRVRLCGNYKITANKVLRADQYPLPTLDEMLHSLQGGEKFTKLDLSNAYLQLELDENSRGYTTVNTHRGLIQYKRLPYGLAAGPGLFQRTMETLLADVPMCKAFWMM